MMKKSIPVSIVFICGLTCITATGASSPVHVVPAGSRETTISDGKTQPAVKFATIRADDKGATHISYCRFEGMEYKSYAPPAAAQWVGVSPDEIESMVYAVLPPGYVGSWHRPPGPQWVVTLAGKWSVETTDGSTVVRGPGEVLYNDDMGALVRPGDDRVGHLSRTVGDEPNVQLIIKLKAGANRSHISHACAY